MSTDELRRGPGWWMDVEGVWNPPELWPESTPPLPGWIRDEKGHWIEPEPLTPPPLPAEVAAHQPVTDDRLELGYIDIQPSGDDAAATPHSAVEPVRALSAAAVAAGIALVLIVVLLLIT